MYFGKLRLLRLLCFPSEKLSGIASFVTRPGATGLRRLLPWCIRLLGLSKQMLCTGCLKLRKLTSSQLCRLEVQDAFTQTLSLVLWMAVSLLCLQVLGLSVHPDQLSLEGYP